MSATPSIAANSDTPSKRPPTPAKDLEYGDPRRPSSRARNSHGSSKKASLPADNQDAAALPWDPSHPCFPHINSHVPLSSPLYESTRIIRIPRDWMIAGDLAPTFSNTYPEILEPWVSEADFRTLVSGVNEGLIATFSPYGWRAWTDLLLGILSGWLWEDAGFAGVKKGCRDVEAFIERWNGDRRKSGFIESNEEADLIKVVPLRRTGYVCLDIQIPDPKLGIVESKEGSLAEGGGGPNDGHDGYGGHTDG